MDFDHTDGRELLSDTLRRYLANRYGFERRVRYATSPQGWSSERWGELAELGIPAALIDETVGGLGGGGFDIAAVFEQVGRALVVEPFLGLLMAGRALAKAPEHLSLLDQALAGSAILAFAHYEPQSRYDLQDVRTRAERRDGDWSLTGAKAVAPQLESADRIVVSALQGKGGSIGLFLVEKDAPGLDVHGYELIDGGRAGELILSGTPATRIADDGLAVIEDAMAAGLVALCWEAIGVMDVIQSSTLEYLRTRRQFGAPIGKFQALQHRMATVALEIEQARSSAINAAAALDGDDRRARDRAASAAKFTIGRVGTLVAEEAIQMHGGIGMTWELPLSHYAKRLIMIDHQLGDEDHHLERYIALGRDDAPWAAE